MEIFIGFIFGLITGLLSNHIFYIISNLNNIKLLIIRFYEKKEKFETNIIFYKAFKKEEYLDSAKKCLSKMIKLRNQISIHLCSFLNENKYKQVDFFQKINNIITYYSLFGQNIEFINENIPIKKIYLYKSIFKINSDVITVYLIVVVFLIISIFLFVSSI